MSLDVLDIDTKLLKIASPFIAPSLTHVYNLSLYNGVVPNDFKKARITPVFKNKGDRNIAANYRPISVISHFGKVLEDIVKKQLVDFLLKHRLLSSNQFAYIKGKSTQTALHTITESLLRNIDNGEITAACFLDLSKCFDTVSHHILLHKLKHMGVKNTELNWFASYLNNRTQIVRSNGLVSRSCCLTIGVPQGTILGPLLFLIYANELPSCLSTGTCIMYADDITLFCSSKTLDSVESKLQKCVTETITWLKLHKLVVNPSKSNTMLFGSRQKINQSTINITINGTPVVASETFKLLGITFDSNLTRRQHVSQLVKKLSSKVGLTKRLCSFLPRSVLIKLYAPLFQSNLDYCLTVWGHCANKYIKQLQKLQNRLARVITNNFNRDVSSSHIINTLGWMSVKQRFEYLMGCYMYKCLNNDNHNSVIPSFNFISNVHSYNTRLHASKSLAIPLPKTEYFKHSLSYRGSVIWNNIPSNVKNNSTSFTFKKQYKSIILNT